MNTIPTVRLPGGQQMPMIGFGTFSVWQVRGNFPPTEKSKFTETKVQDCKTRFITRCSDVIVMNLMSLRPSNCRNESGARTVQTSGQTSRNFENSGSSILTRC